MSDPRYRGRNEDGSHSWLIRPRIDGVQHSVTFRTPTKSKRAAIDHARDNGIEAKLRRRVARASKKKAAPGSIADLVDDWTERGARRWAPKTAETNRLHSSRIRDRFGSVLVEELEARDVERWFDELADAGTGPASVLRTWETWRSIIRFGVEQRDYMTNVHKKVAKPRHRPKRIDLPTNAALQIVLADLSGDAGRAIRLLAETGMRRGECVGLKWEDVAGDVMRVERAISNVGRRLYVGPTKGDRERVISLSDGAQAVLAEQRAEVASLSPWVFPAWDADVSGGTPHRPDWLSGAWTRHRARHGLDGTNLHHLRHAFATRAFSANVPIHAIQSQLGHANASTTSDMYGHADEAGRDALRRSMNGPLEIGP